MLARTRARRLTKSPQRASQVIDWRELAECKGWSEKGIDPWFPESLVEPKAWETAAKICAACPVAQQCLEAAMAEEKGIHGRQRHGMYGGLKPEERHNLYRSRERARKNAEGKAA